MFSVKMVLITAWCEKIIFKGMDADTRTLSGLVDYVIHIHTPQTSLSHLVSNNKSVMLTLSSPLLGSVQTYLLTSYLSSNLLAG